MFECLLHTAAPFVCPNSYVRKDINSSIGRTKKEIEERKSTTLTHGGVGKWAEELPSDLWELVLGNLGAEDRLSCVTSTKVMMEKYEKGAKLAALREEARDEIRREAVQDREA